MTDYDALLTELDEGGDWLDARSAAAIRELRKDAERYRWLRANWDQFNTCYNDKDGQDYAVEKLYLRDNDPASEEFQQSVDAAIDAALAGEKP